MNRLAIVIPYYKIDFFEETLKSVADQTDQRFTLYIGNDASPSDPLPLIQKYFKEDEYRYFNYIKNIGGKNLALQWERVLENVTEDWFQILGDDDAIAENFVEEFYNNIGKFKSVVRFNRKTLNDKNVIIREDKIVQDSISSVDLFINGYSGLTVTSLTEFIFKTTQFKKYKFEKIDLAWGTDVIAFMQFSDFKNIQIINSTEVYIKVTEKSITGNNSSLKTKKDLAFNHFRKILLEKHAKFLPSEVIEKLIRDYHTTSICYGKLTELNLWKIYLKRWKLISFFKKNYRQYQVNKTIFGKNRI